MPSLVSQAEVRLGDLGHAGANFGLSPESQTVENAILVFQRKFETSAMLLFEVAFFF